MYLHDSFWLSGQHETNEDLRSDSLYIHVDVIQQKNTVTQRVEQNTYVSVTMLNGVCFFVAV